MRKALVEVVTELVPDPPVPMEWGTFGAVLKAFIAERNQRQEQGGGTEKARSVRERDEARHQFLAAWPSPASDLDPVALGLGSWAFDGGLPPYVPRAADADLADRLRAPGITVVTGPPKSGKSRSILQTLQHDYQEAVVWWANPTPTVLPTVVEAAKAATRKEAHPEERPRMIVLDDAFLLGADPAGGLTAQRMKDLAATGAHILVVLHEETLTNWENQLSHRTPNDMGSASDLSGLGVTRELMNFLQHRVRYDSVLTDGETDSAAEAYDGADERIRSFDLTRLAETFAGVQALRSQARNILADHASVVAALLEAAIDATIAFPSGADEDVLAVLAQAHYRRRQPNRPWRGDKFRPAFDALTTGITQSSPHAILTTADHTAYRLFDALTPELQHPDRDTSTLIGALQEGPNFTQALVEAVSETGWWHYRNFQEDKAQRAWIHAAESGNSRARFGLGLIAQHSGDIASAQSWWERAAKAGYPEAMIALAGLLEQAGEREVARGWWERAAGAGHAMGMIMLATHASLAGDRVARKIWFDRAFEAAPWAFQIIEGKRSFIVTRQGIQVKPESSEGPAVFLRQWGPPSDQDH